MTDATQKPPREFLIAPHSMKAFDIDERVGNSIHVIEKSAYDALREEVSQLKASRQALRAALKKAVLWFKEYGESATFEDVLKADDARFGGPDTREEQGD